MDLSARFFRIVFPTSIFQTDSSAVHLTFDDGPHPEATSTVLDVLRDSGVQATFFLTGSRVRLYPDLAKRILAEHHCVGNHAYHHTNMVLSSSQSIAENIVAGNDAIAGATGIPPTLFRPPFGYYDHRIVRIVHSLGMTLIHWSHDTRDFSRNFDDSALHRVAQSVRPGSILLLHDNDATAPTIKTYLPRLIGLLHDRGFSFAALS